MRVLLPKLRVNPWRCDLSVTTKVTLVEVTPSTPRAASGIGKIADWLKVGPYASRYATFRCGFESVAQLVEHRPFKALVLGSSPSALTIKPL